MKPVLEGRSPLTEVLGSSACSGMFFWFFKGVLQGNDNPSCSVQIFFLPMHFQGAFSDLLNFAFTLTRVLHAAVCI